MALPAALLEAYRRTEYRVAWTGEPFVLFVDRPSEPLRRCQAAFGVACSTFITAWNPRSMPMSPQVNADAMARLSQRMEERGLAVLPGVGVDPTGKWEGEDSLLVLGLDAPSAIAIARDFEQNAIVCAGADAIPRLVLA